MATGHATRTLILWVAVLCGIFVYVGYRIKSRNDIAAGQPKSPTTSPISAPNVIAITPMTVPRETPTDSPGVDNEPEAEEVDLVPRTPEAETVPPLGGNQPAGESDPVEEMEAELPVERSPEPETRMLYPQPLGQTDPAIEIASNGVRRHTVQPGDSLSRISVRYFGTIDRAGDIYAANRGTLASADALSVGTVLVIPVGASASAPDTRDVSSRPREADIALPPGRQYTIKSGDTIYRIATNFFGEADRDAAMEAIATANAALLDRNGFRAGAKMIIPDTIVKQPRRLDVERDTNNTTRSLPPVSRAAAPSPDAALYTIQAGDTLSSIAKAQYGKSSAWRAIYAANRKKIPNPNHLTTGVAIVLPAGRP